MPALNAFAAHEVSIYIIQNFVGVYIAVVIRCGNGQWMIVIETRHKRTHHKTFSLESLMYGWWLMHASCYWFKIVDRKTIWIVIAVPTDHIKRMKTIVKRIKLVLFFDKHQKVAFFVESLQIAGFFDVTLTERSMFHQLSIFG